MRPVSRRKVWFESGGERCAAWHYPSPGGACVVMAGGAGVTKEPGTDVFAARFQAAGFGVLAFDYRRLGESEGEPRQVIRIGDQLADWVAAIKFAHGLPGVEPDRVALWSFSLSAGHLFEVARRQPVAAVIAQTPFAGGLAVIANAMRHESPGAILRFPFLAIADIVRAGFGGSPLLVPLAGPRGTIAMLTTPDAQDGDRALNPDNSYPDWNQAVAARSVMALGAYRPGRHARGVSCPMLVIVAEDDRSVLARPTLKAVSNAPAVTVLPVEGGHYAPFLDAHEAVVTAELEFLERHLGPRSHADPTLGHDTEAASDGQAAAPPGFHPSRGTESMSRRV